MNTEPVKPPSVTQLRRIDRAAALTAAQLLQAEEVVKSRAPGLKGDAHAIVLAAVLQSITANYATMTG